MATIILHEPWVKAEKLRAEGRGLHAVGDNLYDRSGVFRNGHGGLLAKGRKLRKKASKICDEGRKLWRTGDKLYRASINDFFGENIPFNWVNGKMEPPNKERAVMPFGELFGYDNLT